MVGAFPRFRSLPAKLWDTFEELVYFGTRIDRRILEKAKIYSRLVLISRAPEYPNTLI
jgi:hypothetical protein